jgi:phosphoglycerate dehydrogenase-like enzyme
MYKAIFLNQGGDQVANVFGDGRRQRAESLLAIRPGVLKREELAAAAAELREVEIVFSTWGMPELGEADLVHLPRLRAVLYAAGTVKGFAKPLLERGIQVSSAWRANALPVAEATLAHIILAFKQSHAQARAIRAARTFWTPTRPPITGMYGSTIGLIALGAIGRRVVELLKPFDVRIIAHDPYAKPMPGIELVSLDEVFSRSDVVSMHAPWIPATEGMVQGRHLRLMKPHATFINTSRGKLVVEDEMTQVLSERPDLQAVLDVTWPEPPAHGSALWQLPNVFMTPHIAGSCGNEVRRMADWMIAECEELLAGRPLKHGVSIGMLDTMA